MHEEEGVIAKGDKHIREIIEDNLYRRRIHERTISLRFLILTVLRLEVSVWISLTIGKGAWFSIRFFSFLLCSVLCSI